MTRPLCNVALESIIIGLMNVTIFYALKNIKNLNLDVFWILFITGALIHILFEYTGGNKWWCEQTYKL
jgi:hypothetical protein